MPSSSPLSSPLSSPRCGDDDDERFESSETVYPRRAVQLTMIAYNSRQRRLEGRPRNRGQRARELSLEFPLIFIRPPMAVQAPTMSLSFAYSFEMFNDGSFLSVPRTSSVHRLNSSVARQAISAAEQVSPPPQRRESQRSQRRQAQIQWHEQFHSDNSGQSHGDTQSFTYSAAVAPATHTFGAMSSSLGSALANSVGSLHTSFPTCYIPLPFPLQISHNEAAPTPPRDDNFFSTFRFQPVSEASVVARGYRSNMAAAAYSRGGQQVSTLDANNGFQRRRAQFLHDIAEYLGIGQGATRQIIERSTFLRRYTLAEMIGDVEHKSCCICLEEFVAGEEVRVLPCTHFFHTACIDRWLITNRKCPLCRRNIDNEHLPIAAARLMN